MNDVNSFPCNFTSYCILSILFLLFFCCGCLILCARDHFIFIWWSQFQIAMAFWINYNYSLITLINEVVWLGIDMYAWSFHTCRKYFYRSVLVIPYKSHSVQKWYLYASWCLYLKPILDLTLSKILFHTRTLRFVTNSEFSQDSYNILAK